MATWLRSVFLFVFTRKLLTITSDRSVNPSLDSRLATLFVIAEMLVHFSLQSSQQQSLFSCSTYRLTTTNLSHVSKVTYFLIIVNCEEVRPNSSRFTNCRVKPTPDFPRGRLPPRAAPRVDEKSRKILLFFQTSHTPRLTALVKSACECPFYKQLGAPDPAVYVTLYHSKFSRQFKVLYGI